jgi:hypothetical protein
MVGAMNPIHRCKIIHGELQVEDTTRFKDFLLSLKHDWPYELVIRPIKKSRTLKQNRYYWGVVVELITLEIAGTNSNVEKHEVHRALARYFLDFDNERIFETGGVTFGERISTTELSTVEFNEYIENIQRWAAEYLNIVIPDPDQTDFV